MSRETAHTLRDRALKAREYYGDDRVAGVALARVPLDIFEALVAVEDQDAVHWKTRRTLVAQRDALVAALTSAYNDLDHIAADTASDVDGMTRAGISDFADKCAKRINAVLKDARPTSLTEQVINDSNVDPAFRAALKAAKP